MAAFSLRRRSVLLSVAVLLQPRRVHRTGMHRLQPGAAQGGRGQQQDYGKEPRAAQEPDHRCLTYVLRLRYERGWALTTEPGLGGVARDNSCIPAGDFGVWHGPLLSS